MNHSTLKQDSRTQLIRQLVYFDEEKTGFLTHYFPEPGKQRAAAEELLNRYCSALEERLADFQEDQLDNQVLIGSELQLRYLDDDALDTYTLVFPESAKPEENKVSLLSPVGMQLLLAEPGRTYELQVPSGQLSVQIESCRFINGGEVG
ncbi:GreA/GreB family elongation factor [Paenibacillus albidus]|uniref:GreA/GreB family elongation factor n=1 Tax=Paenibacillus albidus TaxID=2041023 RepID=UPI001BE7752A|nr:GreA/GreB family elongation factor [Paenibacillus albidus]MBT2291235.1 GreA/GreB family elongation factor [Paenibacillus albidus]